MKYLVTAPNTRQLGFTLMELLVVLLIMVTIMSIGAGSLMSSGDRNEIVATERLLSSYIKQARQRSISQGDSVVINISKDENIISGISQVHFIDEHFEWAPIDNQTLEADHLDPSTDLPSTTGLAATDTFTMPFGNSGYGWLDATFTLKARTDIHQRKLLEEDGDGFRLSCSIKAPPADSGPNIIPLLLLTDVAADDTRSSALAGMELWRVPQFIYDVEAAQEYRVGFAWILIAWTDNAAQPTWPTNTNDSSDWNFLKNDDTYVRDWTYTSVRTDDADDQTNYAPYNGDQWIHVSMHYDGKNLALYRNGEEVDYREDNNSTVLPDIETQLYIGHATYSSVLKISAASIDDVTLIRTGSGRSSEFSKRIQAKNDYQIIAHNGDIRCYEIDSSGDYTPTTNIEFVDAGFDDSTSATLDNSLTFTIGTDGSVSSNIASNPESIE